MSVGAWLFLLILGIAALICSGVGCCGCLACCCFAPDPVVTMQQGPGPVVVVTQPGVTSMPVVAQPGAPQGAVYQKNGVWCDANGNPVVAQPGAQVVQGEVYPKA